MMTGRLARIKERLLETAPSLCLERARIYAGVYRDSEQLPVVRRRALALRRTLEEMSIFIDEDELIVGNHSSRPKAAPIFPEYAVDWISSGSRYPRPAPRGILFDRRTRSRRTQGNRRLVEGQRRSRTGRNRSSLRNSSACTTRG